MQYVCVILKFFLKKTLLGLMNLSRDKNWTNLSNTSVEETTVWQSGQICEIPVCLLSADVKFFYEAAVWWLARVTP